MQLINRCCVKHFSLWIIIQIARFALIERVAIIARNVKINTVVIGPIGIDKAILIGKNIFAFKNGRNGIGEGDIIPYAIIQIVFTNIVHL